MTQRMKYSSQSFTNNETGAKVQRLLALNFKCQPPPLPLKKDRRYLHIQTDTERVGGAEKTFSLQFRRPENVCAGLI